MLNKKNIIYPDHVFLNNTIKLYEPVFSKKLEKDIYFDRGGKPIHEGFYLHYFGIKTSNILSNIMNKGGVVWCNLGIQKYWFNKNPIYEIRYMKTAFGYRKNGLQELLQAVLCDIFNIEELHFITTYKKGEKYIENSELFKIKKIIPHIKYPDITCSVDLTKCQELIKLYK